MRRAYVALLAVLAVLFCIVGDASAYSHGGLKNRVWSSGDYPNTYAYNEASPSQYLRREIGPTQYDLASGVDVGPNVYAYVRQNPWSKFDPLGLATVATGDDEFMSTKQPQEEVVRKKTDRQKAVEIFGERNVAAEEHAHANKQFDNYAQDRVNRLETAWEHDSENDAYAYARASLLGKLGDEAMKNGFEDSAKGLWAKQRAQQKANRQAEIASGLASAGVDTLAQAGALLIPGPIDDAALLSRMASRGAAGSGGRGGLNLFRFGDESSAAATGWREGDRFLNLPNKGSPRANWKQNSGRLRAEMRSGEPIYDSYRTSSGIQKPSGQTPTSKGRFLNAERRLLEGRGWEYSRQSGAYHPPAN